VSRLLRSVAATAVLLVSLGGALPAQAQDPAATGAPETADAGPAIDELVGCVQASQRLLVLFLIDESASLKESDPDDRRVDAARGALDSLVALATAEGSASPEVDVAFAAFANEYRLIEDWTRADADSAPELQASLDGFADLNSGIDTDFVNALTDGQVALAERSAEITAAGGRAPCRAVLLFTDGGFDLAVRESDEDQERLGTTKPYAPGIELTTPEAVQEAEAAGRAALCDAGGVADRLRTDRVSLLTVALSGDVARRAQLPLAAATTGRADDYTCGTETDRPSGAYLPADGVDVLVARFNEVGSRLAGGNLLPGSERVEVCGADPCEEGTRRFTLDSSLRRAQILALPPAAGAVVRLVAPSGTSVDLTDATAPELEGIPVSVREVAGRGLTIDLERPEAGAGWDGEWSVTILDPSGEQAGGEATLQVFVFSDLDASISELVPFERGAPAQITVGLSAPEGIDVASLVTEAVGELVVRDPLTGATTTVPLDGPADGPFTGTYEVPADLTANAVELSALVRVTTASDADLVARSAPLEVLVARPAGSVQILIPSLKMPSLTGEGSTEAELLLQGGSAAGCVWFEEVDVATSPEGVTPVDFTLDGAPLPGEADCIAVPAEEARTLLVKATPSGRGSGAVQGSLRIRERVEGLDATTTDVLFRFDLARGVDETQRILLTVLLLLGGLALPMLALLLINALTARFQALDVVRGTALPVRASQGAVTRVDGSHARSFSLRESDFGSLAGSGSDRRFTFGGVEFRARASRNPFGATIAMAAPEGGAERLKGNAGSRVELDPGLSGSWVFLLDPDKTRRAQRGDAEGLLIAFIAEGDANAQLQRMLPDVQKRLPGIADRLAGLVRASSPKAAKPSKRRSAETAPRSDADGSTDGDGQAAAPCTGGAEPEGGRVEGAAAHGDPAGGAGPSPSTETEDGPATGESPDGSGPDAAGAANAPVGFGGAPVAEPPLPRLPPDEPIDAPASEDRPDDDGPPVGFTGGRPG
jgi:hypothetical protein